MNLDKIEQRIEYIILAASIYFVGASISSGNYFLITASFFMWSFGLTILRLSKRHWNWDFYIFLVLLIIWTVAVGYSSFCFA